jgi:hypothetical protein
VKIPATLAFCAALACAATAAPCAAVAAAPATPAPAATPTPDPAILARAKTMFAQIQAGKVDRTQLDAEANATIDDATLKRAHTAVQALGTPVTFEQQNVFIRDGVTNYVYLVTFGGAQSLDFGFFLDSAGKVRGMAILPPTP